LRSRDASSDLLPARAVGVLAKVCVCLYFVMLAAVNLRYFQTTGTLSSLGLVLVSLLIVVLFVARRERGELSERPLHWCIGFVATVLPLLFRPGPPGNEVQILCGDTIQILGLAVTMLALVSLQRSFGIVPANRGVRTLGLYRFVRHPLYAGELSFLLGYALANPSAWNLALWAIEISLQCARVRFEEGFLDRDPDYRRYRERVRCRFIPGVL